MLCGCTNSGNVGTIPTSSTIATTTVVTTIDRNTITNPEKFTKDEIEIIHAMWKRWQKNHPDTTDTIDKIAALLPDCSLIPCRNGYVLDLMIDYNDTSPVLYTETIGGYEFRHTSIMALDYYSDGEFYLLKDAYESGVITDDELRIAWEGFRALYESRYTTDADDYWVTGNQSE